jgi:hypothetical protein
MSKSKSAHTEFEPAIWYLAHIIRAGWISLPVVGAKERNTLAIQVKLTILYKLSALPPDVPDTVEFVGREAVVYLPATVDRQLATRDGRQFLADARIAPDTEPQADVGWLRVQFGEPDPCHQFQSIVAWESVDGDSVAAVTIAAAATLRTAKRRPAPELGLGFPGQGVVTKDGKSIDFAGKTLCWSAMKCLAYHYPNYVKPETLVLEVWPAVGRKSLYDAKSAARDLIRQLRKLISSHGLRIPAAVGGRGWRLEKF